MDKPADVGRVTADAEAQGPRRFADLDQLQGAVGQVLGVSSWVEITQERIDRFADATDDHQWIHVDRDRAESESPWGTTIAHGYLTLSLVPRFLSETFLVETKTTGINYGVDKVRFTDPVKSGTRVRGTVTLAAVDRLKPDTARLHTDVVISIEGEDKPAAVARVISVLVTA